MSVSSSGSGQRLRLRLRLRTVCVLLRKARSFRSLSSSTFSLFSSVDLRDVPCKYVSCFPRLLNSTHSYSLSLSLSTLANAFMHTLDECKLRFRLFSVFVLFLCCFSSTHKDVRPDNSAQRVSGPTFTLFFHHLIFEACAVGTTSPLKPAQGMFFFRSLLRLLSSSALHFLWWLTAHCPPQCGDRALNDTARRTGESTWPPASPSNHLILHSRIQLPLSSSPRTTEKEVRERAPRYDL
jgi:hypothetical protein